MVEQIQIQSTYFGEPEEEHRRAVRKRCRVNVDADALLKMQFMWDNSYESKKRIASAIIREYVRKNEITKEGMTDLVRRDFRLHAINPKS